MQRLADRVSAVFVPTVLVLAAGTLIWRAPRSWSRPARVDTIVLDKTGTVTAGRMSLVDAVPSTGEDLGTVLRIAGALEQASEHPIARAIAAAAADAPLRQSLDFANSAGLGVTGRVEGRVAAVGRAAFPIQQGMAIPGELEAARMHAEDAGRTPVLLTGDNERAALAVTTAVGIHDVRAEVLPADKAAVVKSRQQDGHVVAMVGDGINDAAALAQADLGLAIGTGTDAAIEASDLTLVTGDLRAAGDAIRLPRRTLATIKGNLFWAFAYNVAAIPLAMAGPLNPLIAAAAMAASSVFVVTNGLRLHGFAAEHAATD